MRYLKLIAIIAGLAGFTPGALADTLLVDTMQANSSVATPDRGMNTSQVLSRFGEPQLRGAAVGQPPISQWNYGSFIVYFEYDRVIHAVATRQ